MTCAASTYQRVSPRFRIALVPGPIVVTRRNIKKIRQTGLDGNADQTAVARARIIKPDDLA